MKSKMITQNKTIASLLRRAPEAQEEESIFSIIQRFRETGMDTLPIINRRGNLVGVISHSDLLRVLEQGEDARYQPCGSILHKPSAVVMPDMNMDDLHALFMRSGESTLFLIDEHERLMGYFQVSDLIAPESMPLRPFSAGGLATPWGVYLTSGSLQAGISNFTLALGGAVLGIMFTLSHAMVGLMAWMVQKYANYPLYKLWNAPQPDQMNASAAGWFLLQFLAVPLFALVLRFSPITGYHGAEHKAVHALERGEPLHPAILRRMPRVHPRCGTNLIAAALIFGVISQIAPMLHLGLDMTDGAVIGAIAALYGWRSLGSMIQQYITTRTPSEKQLASGIAAAKELEKKYQSTFPRRPSILRRIWCMGIPQTLLGVTVGTALLSGILSLVFPFLSQ
jgi:CBS domain-containing protein